MVGLDNPIHIALVLVIVLLVFGAKRLPEMGRSLGSGLRGFKESLSGESDSDHTPKLTELSTEHIDAATPTQNDAPSRAESEQTTISNSQTELERDAA